MELKFPHYALLEKPFHMVSFFAEVKISRFWPKTMDYSQVFFFGESEKVLRKVCHSKGNEKRNLITLISVA